MISMRPFKKLALRSTQSYPGPDLLRSPRLDSLNELSATHQGQHFLGLLPLNSLNELSVTVQRTVWVLSRVSLSSKRSLTKWIANRLWRGRPRSAAAGPHSWKIQNRQTQSIHESWQT